MTNHAVRLWRERAGTATFPPAFIEAAEVSPRDQIAMQAAAQAYVDGAISKTVQLAPDARFESFRPLFREAHALGLKGCTVFRPGTARGSLLVPVSPCCLRTAELDDGGTRDIPDRLAPAGEYLSPGNPEALP